VARYLPTIIEFTAMAVLWLVATGITMPIRRRLSGSGESFKPRGPGGLVVYILQPLLVLVLTQLVLLASTAIPSIQGWLDTHFQHVVAWEMFWVGVAILLLLEGLGTLVFRRRGREFPIPDLLLDIIRLLLILGLAFAVLKIELGIDIAPLLASTALITAVVGFALQGVLGNLLAGMSLHISRSVMPGDWISLGETEGKIMQTNWRETRIRTMGGHVMVVPNSRVAESIIHNMVRPTPVRRHAINVGASYSDAPDRVIAALVEAAREVPEVNENPAPDAYVTEYQDYGINYQLRYWTRDYHRRVQIDGEVNRMIWYKFKRRGIEIPFPMSDKLLNDFMAVVYNQRKLDPRDEDLARIVTELTTSGLARDLVVDEAGVPLLGAAEFERIAPLVRRVRYTHGETLFKQGEAGETCYLLVEGTLIGRVYSDSGEVAVEFALNSGAVVGEMSLMLAAPRSAEVVVDASAVLLELGPEAFRALLELGEGVPEAFAGLAAERAETNRDALQQWAAQQGEPVEDSLSKAGFLSRFLRMIGR